MKIVLPTIVVEVANNIDNDSEGEKIHNKVQDFFLSFVNELPHKLANCHEPIYVTVTLKD